MRTILILYLIITCISFAHLSGQSPHSFTLEPTVIFGQSLYSFSGMYTPNGKDFFSRSHGNYLSDPIYTQFSDQAHSWGSVGYLRKILEAQNGSFFYGQISIEFHETTRVIGLGGGLGWMKSLGSNAFLDINLNYNYLTSHARSNIRFTGPANQVQLPINLKSFLTLDDFRSRSFDLNETKWRIRKHSFGLMFSSRLSRNELSLHSDLNVGYRLQKWLIIEGILSGQHDFYSSAFATIMRYGLGVSIQPFQWKRLLPYAGISLEADYYSLPSSAIIAIPFIRENRILVSDYNIGLEYRFNRHFSWSLQYTAPVFDVPSFLPTRPQFELGTVYQF